MQGIIYGTVIVVVAAESPSSLSLRHALAGAGFDVCATQTAAEAAAIMEERSADAILADYTLPDRTGVWVLQLATTLQPEALRVLIAGDPRIDGQRLAARGVCHVATTKPIDADAVTGMLEAAGVTPRPVTAAAG